RYRLDGHGFQRLIRPLEHSGGAILQREHPGCLSTRIAKEHVQTPCVLVLGPSHKAHPRASRERAPEQTSDKLSLIHPSPDSVVRRIRPTHHWPASRILLGPHH